MTVVHNERGTALVATLILGLILLPLGALVALQCRTDLNIQRNLRSDVETLYVAEAGLAHALSEIAPGQSFDEILAGPDHVAGTPDDGVFPFVDGPPPAFPNAPFRYEVHVASAGANLLRLSSHAGGVNGAAKVVAQLLTRSADPFTPAAFYTEASRVNLDLGAAYRLSGIDHQAAFPPLPDTDATALPAVSTPDPDAEASLRTSLTGTAAGQIAGAGIAPSVGTTTRLDVTAYAERLAHAPTAEVRGAGAVGDAGWGSTDAPALSIVPGDLEVTGHLTGCGVLIVRGALRVAGALEFAGLVLALGPVILEASSTATVVGTLWQAASEDARLELGGDGAVVYSSHALSVAERVAPGVLPHAVVVVGWQEEL